MTRVGINFSYQCSDWIKEQPNGQSTCVRTLRTLLTICLNLTLEAGMQADRQDELPGFHPAFLRLPFSC